MKICARCGKEIPEGSGNHRKYCSVECRRCAGRNIKEIGKRARKILPIKEQIFQAYDCRCAICGWRGCDEPGMVGNNGHHQWGCMNQIHHIIPVSKGGEETADNLILLCPNHHRMADLGIIPIEELQEMASRASKHPVFREPKRLNMAGSTFGQYWREYTLKALEEKGLQNVFSVSGWASQVDEEGRRGFGRGYMLGFEDGWRKGVEELIETVKTVQTERAQE